MKQRCEAGGGLRERMIAGPLAGGGAHSCKPPGVGEEPGDAGGQAPGQGGSRIRLDHPAAVGSDKVVGAGMIESDGGNAGSEGFNQCESVTLVAGGEQIEVCGLEERCLAFARHITGEADLGVPKPGSERAEPGGVPVALHESGFAADKQPEWLGQEVLTLTLEQGRSEEHTSELQSQA